MANIRRTVPLFFLARRRAKIGTHLQELPALFKEVTAPVRRTRPSCHRWDVLGHEPDVSLPSGKKLSVLRDQRIFSP